MLFHSSHNAYLLVWNTYIYLRTDVGSDIRRTAVDGQIDFTFTICLLDENLRSRWSFGLAVPDLASGSFTNYVGNIF